MIRFNDVSAAYNEQREEINGAIADVLDHGDFISGRAIAEFERSFAAYTGSGACAGVSSGTSALHLAMLAAGVGPGDEVITTPMTFIATAEAISLCGAKPVFADIDPVTLNLDPGAIAAAITSATRAVLFVYLHGNPGGAQQAWDVAEAHDLQFFEDCAQAHGAHLPGSGSHVGSLGTASGYSFFPAKNLGAFGDAGAVTGSSDLVARVRQLANHGRSEKYLHEVEGLNARMDTLQAAVLLTKLEILDRQVEQRNRIAERYIENLADLPLQFQPAPRDGRHAWHLFTVRTPHRDALQQHLATAGIETGIHYPVPLHLQPAYAFMGYKKGDYPVAETTANQTLSLPMYPQLPLASVDDVCAEVRRFFKE